MHHTCIEICRILFCSSAWKIIIIIASVGKSVGATKKLNVFVSIGCACASYTRCITHRGQSNFKNITNNQSHASVQRAYCVHCAVQFVANNNHYNDDNLNGKLMKPSVHVHTHWFLMSLYVDTIQAAISRCYHSKHYATICMSVVCLCLQIISITSCSSPFRPLIFAIHFVDAARTIMPCILTRHDNDWWHQNICGLNACQARISIRNIVYYSALLILLGIDGGVLGMILRVCDCVSVLPFRREMSKYPWFYPSTENAFHQTRTNIPLYAARRRIQCE